MARGRRGGDAPGSEPYERMYAAWLDDFETRSVESIAFGVITLQKPAEERERFVDLLDKRGPVAASMGPTIDAGLRVRTWLAQRSDDDLLDAT